MRRTWLIFSQAVTVAQRCLATLHEPFAFEDLTLSVVASIGLALAPVHGRDGASILRAADQAPAAQRGRPEGGAGAFGFPSGIIRSTLERNRED